MLLRSNKFILGAVAYAPQVVTIWEGFKAYFIRRGLPFDYILYSNYEAQVEALLAGHCDVAWNSPLAWVRADRLARAQGKQVQVIAMRDSDCDLRSVIIVRADSAMRTIGDLRGKVVAVGAIDSPQASLLPLAHLQAQGLVPGVDFEVQRHNLLPGKHGDHIGGEREAARSLVLGGADAACLIGGNHELFIADGTIAPGATCVLTQTTSYDHCNVTVGPNAPADLVERFRMLLLNMSYDDSEIRPYMELEGVKSWCNGRTAGYRALEAAVDTLGLYDQRGTIIEVDYTY